MKPRFFVLVTVLALIGGCDPYAFRDRFPFGGVDLQGRAPIPVEPGVDKVLTEWERHRKDSKSLYATYKRTVHDAAFKNTRVVEGSIRLRHGEVFRADLKEPREVFLYTKKNEFWHLMAKDRIADVWVFGEKGRHSWAATPFAWFAPTTKETIQKHGRIRKTGETSTTIELRVENAKPKAQDGYEWMNVVLKKADYLPSKLEVKESADTIVVWEFLETHENVEIDESDFTPPTLGPEWRIHRHELDHGKVAKVAAPKKDDPHPKSP